VGAIARLFEGVQDLMGARLHGCKVAWIWTAEDHARCTRRYVLHPTSRSPSHERWFVHNFKSVRGAKLEAAYLLSLRRSTDWSVVDRWVQRQEPVAMVPALGAS